MRRGFVALVGRLAGWRLRRGGRVAPGRPAGSAVAPAAAPAARLRREAALFQGGLLLALLALVSPLGYWSGLYIWVRALQDTAASPSWRPA